MNPAKNIQTALTPADRIASAPQRSSLTVAQRRAVRKAFAVYRNMGTLGTGQWVYQPHDFDSSFELWSATFATRRAATEAAYAELSS
jgi:hypothetical protein